MATKKPASTSATAKKDTGKKAATTKKSSKSKEM